jgi:hypothetical protein
MQWGTKTSSRRQTRVAAHMGMFEVKGQVWSVHGQFSGRWFGSKV